MKTLIRLALTAMLVFSVAVPTSILLENEAVAQDKSVGDSFKKGPSSGPFAKYGGMWGSEWGPVWLTWKGNSVVGQWKDGQFSGTVNKDKILNYKWTSTNNSKGSGMFYFMRGGQMGGTWGYGGSVNNGGDWLLYHPKKK